MGTRIASNLHFSPQKSTFATSSQAGNSASAPLPIPLRLRHLDCSPVDTPQSLRDSSPKTGEQFWSWLRKAERDINLRIVRFLVATLCRNDMSV